MDGWLNVEERLLEREFLEETVQSYNDGKDLDALQHSVFNIFVLHGETLSVFELDDVADLYLYTEKHRAVKTGRLLAVGAGGKHALRELSPLAPVRPADRWQRRCVSPHAPALSTG